MRRTHYSAELNEELGVIEVIDRCGMDGITAVSVTNAAEEVVADLVREYGNHAILYRDTTGRWDWLIHENGRFIKFSPGPIDGDLIDKRHGLNS